MDNSPVNPMHHVDVPPLRIERDYPGGREVIIIEGVRYDADYFRTFAHPETDTLYGIRADEDVVRLTCIRNVEEAIDFFENIGGA